MLEGGSNIMGIVQASPPWPSSWRLASTCQTSCRPTRCMRYDLLCTHILVVDSQLLSNLYLHRQSFQSSFSSTARLAEVSWGCSAADAHDRGRPPAADPPLAQGGPRGACARARVSAREPHSAQGPGWQPGQGMTHVNAPSPGCETQDGHSVLLKGQASTIIDSVQHRVPQSAQL